MLGFGIVTDTDACLDLCAGDYRCNWWSFDSSDGFCTLTDDCPTLDQSCETCISGQKDCEGVLSKHWTYLNRVEMNNDDKSSFVDATNSFVDARNIFVDDRNLFVIMISHFRCRFLAVGGRRKLD